MGGNPGKVIRNMKGTAQKYLGVGFLLGFFLVLLTYFTVSEQFAITAPNGESVVLCLVLELLWPGFRIVQQKSFALAVSEFLLTDSVHELCHLASGSFESCFTHNHRSYHSSSEF